MSACQAITRSGGWPLNMFLTPALKPFTGGTYYPPAPRYGKPSWLDVLAFVSDVWKNKREEALRQAETLTTHAAGSERKVLSLELPNADRDVTPEVLINELLKNLDSVNGGFGGAPKFPASMNLTFLLRAGYFLKHEHADQALQLSLDRMMKGGIFDQVGGGFARYTVDAGWLVPHFEKMLYDNALLMSLYAEAAMRFKDEAYLNVAERTADFVLRELTHEKGGFYSSLDADSEGEEGKFYTWSKEEVDEVLGEDAVVFCKLFDVTEAGNWEGKNILHLNHNEGQALRKPDGVVSGMLDKLFSRRESRIRPSLDDKINVAWNVWMASAFCQLYRASGNEKYLQVAENCISFLLDSCRADNGELWHIWTNGKAQIRATIDDYSSVIQACLQLFQLNGDPVLLDTAIELDTLLEQQFLHRETGMYYQSGVHDADLPERTMELFDHATPSGNAMTAINLNLLFRLTGREDYRNRFDTMLKSIIPGLVRYPGSFGMWLNAAIPNFFGSRETIVTGKEALVTIPEIHRAYYPLLITAPFCDKSLEKWPLFTDRYSNNVTRIFYCEDGACRLPVSEVSEYLRLVESN
jgi:uncharacterized protein YyaL (SSP411 family)